MSKVKRKTPDYYAKFVIYGLKDMPTTTRCRVSRWLKQVADDVTEGGNYAKVFTAKLMK